jgi:hypothetical protein
VVSAIVGIVMAVIGACLVGGIRVWDRAQTLAVIESDAEIGLRILEKDVMNTFPFYGSRFEGETAGLSFPALVTAGPAEPGDNSKRVAETRMGNVKYRFDPRKKALFRQAHTYPEDNTEAGVSEKLLSHLEDVDVRYYAPATREKAGEWKESWTDETNFPSRVRIQLAFARGPETATITRTILVPMERTQNSRKQ